MNSEDVLTAFGVWLQTKRLPMGITAPQVLGVTREFAKAIEPEPLAEATAQQMDAFQRGDLPSPRSLVAKISQRVKARFRHDQIEYAMSLFRDFRKNLPKEETP